MVKELADMLSTCTDEELPTVQMAMSDDIDVCENEPVLPYPGDCESVDNLPVLL